MPRGRQNQNQTQESEAQNLNPQENQQTGTVPFDVTVKYTNQEKGLLATADVKVGDLMTIRNVKIKKDDYGLTVTMPRTQEHGSDEYKDSVFFSTKELKENFDKAVKQKYESGILTMDLDSPMEHTEETEALEEQDDGMGQDMAGMSMGM